MTDALNTAGGININIKTGNLYVDGELLGKENITVQLSEPQRIIWTPSKDITGHEMAECLPFLIQMSMCGNIYHTLKDQFKELSTNCHRHFTIQI